MPMKKLIVLTVMTAALSLAGWGCASHDEHSSHEHPKSDHPTTEHPKAEHPKTEHPE